MTENVSREETMMQEDLDRLMALTDAEYAAVLADRIAAVRAVAFDTTTPIDPWLGGLRFAHERLEELAAVTDARLDRLRREVALLATLRDET